MKKKLGLLFILALLVSSIFAGFVSAAIGVTSNWEDGSNSLELEQGEDAQFLVWFTSTTQEINYEVRLYDSNWSYNVINSDSLNAYTFNDYLSLDTSNLEGDYTLRVMANDGVSGYDYVDLSLTVNIEEIIEENNAPSTPTGSSLSGDVYVGDTLYAYGAGSTDVDGDSIEYQYNFMSSGWSSSNSLIITQDLAHDEITVDIRAFDGEDYSPYESLYTTVLNSLPIGQDYSYEITLGETVSETLSSSDSDGDNLVYSIVDLPQAFLFTFYSTGEFSYVSSFSGEDSFTYNVYDGYGYSSTYTVSITINEDIDGNSAPVIDSINDQEAVCENTFNLQVNANDVDNDNITYSDDSGLFDIGSDGLISFIPLCSDEGSHLITITVSDGNLSDTEEFNLVITVEEDEDDDTSDDDEDVLKEVMVYGVCSDDGNGDNIGVRIVILHMMNDNGVIVFSQTTEQECYIEGYGNVDEVQEYVQPSTSNVGIIILTALIFLGITSPIISYLFRKI